VRKEEALMNQGAPVTRLVAGLPATVPFVGPEALERQMGRAFALRLGANESNFGPSPRAQAAMQAASGRVSNYADPENHILRSALAERLNVKIEQVLVGSGIDDLLGLVVRAFLERGEYAVTSLGAYPTFNYHVEGYGARLERVPYRNDLNDLHALAEAAHRVQARLVYLANPDNPTGSWHHAADVQALMERLPDGCTLLLDEAYFEIGPPEAIPPIVADDPRVLRMRTFSKAYGMAGMRIGYAVGPEATIRTFEKIRLHYGVNLLALEGALASLEDDGFLRSVVASVAAGREDYTHLARELDMTPLPSATNFVTMDVGGPERARRMVAALAAEGVFIRMPGAAPLNRCIRITVGQPGERAAFAEILRRVWPVIRSSTPTA
jgi:histidinol-phosphate aminotransferase